MRPSLFCLASLLALAGCGSGGSFKDDLQFGTGLDGTGMGLTGISESFDTKTTKALWFRLESAANFDNRFVRLYLNKLEQKDYASCAAADAHICLSQFSVSTPGTYAVDAYLVQTIIDIGKETLVTKRTFTLR
jgi:hypothetical protein